MSAQSAQQEGDWSSRQGRILTGDGRLDELYQAPDFPFQEDELPHFHKMRGSTWTQFRRWRREGRSNGIVAGVWTRPLFVGGWEHSDNVTGETVFNLQTPSIFLDMRVPKGVDFSRHRGFETMTLGELRLFARRHAFCGYTLVAGEPAVATRHHAIDWNFVGKKRSRPNKWRIEVRPDGAVWKEWGFAKDAQGQHVYMERWELLPGSSGPYLAMRGRSCNATSAAAGGAAANAADAVLIVCGDHFGYISDRPTQQPFDPEDAAAPGLQKLVDDAAVAAAAAVAAGQPAEAAALRRKIVKYLSLEASHGRVSTGVSGNAPWTVDCSLQPWLRGQQLMQPGDAVVAGDGASVAWRGQDWEVLECTFTPAGLMELFAGGQQHRSRI